MNPKRKLVYRVPDAIGVSYNSVSVSFWVAITEYLTSRSNNESSAFFTTRQAVGSINSTTATGDTMGIEIFFIWNPDMDISGLLVMIRTIIQYKNASGGLYSAVFDIKVPEESEKFHHILITADYTGIKLYRDKLLYGEMFIAPSFAEQGYKIGNIAEYCIGCAFGDRYACRFDASDVALFTTIVDPEFAYNLRAETTTGVDSLVVYNRCKMKSLDVSFLSIGGTPFNARQ